MPSLPCEAISTPPFLLMCEFLPKWLYRDCEARCHPFCLAKHRKEGRYVFLFRSQLCRRRQNVINLIALLSMAPSWRFHLPLPLSLSRSLARRCSIPALAWPSELGESSGEGIESFSFQENKESIFISSLAHDCAFKRSPSKFSWRHAVQG